MIIDIDKSTFDEEITQPCIVDFYTSGCPACDKLAPVFEQMSEQIDSVRFLKVNLDNDISLAERYSLKYVPTLMLFNGGEPVSVSTGFMDIGELTSFINSGEDALK